MNQTFTSRGIVYHLVDDLTFCSIYYGDHNTTDDYIRDCLTAEAAPQKGLWKKKDEDYYFYLHPEVTQEDILYVVMDHLEEECQDETFLDAFYWAVDLVDSFWFLLSKPRIKAI